MTPIGMSSQLGLIWRAMVIAARTVLAIVMGVPAVVLAGRGARMHVAGTRAASLCEGLGPAFVKVAQLMSTRGDVLHRDFREPLGRLRDDARAMSPSRARGRLEASLGKERAARLTARGLLQLIGAASVASVFKATLPSGAVVAVKIRDPAAAGRMTSDLRILVAASDLLARLPMLDLVPVRESITQVADLLERQLDFREEARCCEALGRELASNTVLIPIVVREYSSEAVLTMEYLPQAAVAPTAIVVADRAPAVETALRALYCMIFVVGIVHCDLHPGNLTLLDDGGIAIVDFGLFVELSDADRRDFAVFFVSMAEGNGDRCAEIALSKATTRRRSFDEQAFTREIRQLVAAHSGRRPRDFQVAAFVARLIDAQRRHGLRSTTGFTQAIIALLVFEGTVKSVAPDLDFQAAARPFLLPAIVELRPDLPQMSPQAVGES